MTGENSHLPCQLAIQAPNLFAFQVRFLHFLVGFVGIWYFVISGVIWRFKGILLIFNGIRVSVTFQAGFVCQFLIFTI